MKVEPFLISALAFRGIGVPFTYIVSAPSVTDATFESLENVAVLVFEFQSAFSPSDSASALTGNIVYPLPATYGASLAVIATPFTV